MVRKTELTIASVALLSTPTLSAQYLNPNGKFIKCAAAAPVKPARCKVANGKFVKRGTPGATST